MALIFSAFGLAVCSDDQSPSTMEEACQTHCACVVEAAILDECIDECKLEYRATSAKEDCYLNNDLPCDRLEQECGGDIF